MLDFTVSILKDADIDDDEVRVGVLSYRHNTTVEIHLDDYHNRDDLFNAIQSIRYVRGSTATGDAIQRMREDMFDFRHGDRPNVDNVCIVITDGDSDNYTHTVDQAKLARDNGIHIFAIGIALKNLTELKNIATPAPGDGNVLSIDDFDHLESLRGKIFASICTECGSALADIVFVLDSSESVDLSNWGKLLTFVEDIIASADVDTGKTRIGLETYRHNVTVEFHLDEHIRTQNMIDHVMGIPYVRGSTNTADAIENMFDVMFSPKYGDRPNVPNIAIVITDGLSDDSESTMEAAELAKAEGIHIYAIAVGLKVSAELRAIASDPWKQNLFTLENFDDLVSLRAQMFDAIASACPQSPRQCPTKPCGSKQYDPRTQVCCNGEPQPLYQNEKFTMCCAQVSYDKRTQMCCKDKDLRLSYRLYDSRTGSTTLVQALQLSYRLYDARKGYTTLVNKIPSGAKKPVCCEDKAMDPVHAMCCAGDVIPKSSPDADVCCGSSTYSEKTGICCEDILYQNKWAKDGACCVMKDGSTEVYDTRCYDCINGTLVPKYDCAFQRCCDGVIQEITSPSSCCCGKKAFDPEDQICCDGKLTAGYLTACAKNIVDIVIVLDSSESVSEVNWRKMEEAVEDIIGAAAIPESRFGLLTYNHFSTIRFQMNTFVNKQELLDAVDNLPYIRGSTDTGTALETMRGMFNPKFGDRQDAPNFCLLMTDGESDDYDNTIEQANLAKKKGEQEIQS
ncbi:CO6A4-like protein [Mya arenaria]|uniref:CO6A4-like protein n=1 Tax=Mya arenaria TaxID=6604 RepID=A0ABY7FTL6_MYAAR|nr:CO6A4-like protein [Mya arenaria]